MTVSTQGAPALLPGPGVYGIDPEATTIAMITRHLFGLGEVRGSFDVTGGRVTVDGHTGEADVAVTVDAGSIDTGNRRRDAAVRSDGLLGSDAHPEITFRSTGVSREGEGWVVRGELTVRGAAAPVDLRVVELRETTAGLNVRAAATVDRYAHGMTRFKGVAARRVYLEIDARADRIG